MTTRGFVGERCAQATVEMAVVAPVMLVLAIIVYNVMTFLVATARFDRVAPDIVLAHGVSSAGEGGGGVEAPPMEEEVMRNLERAMEGHDVTVEVRVEDVDRTGRETVDSGGPMLSMIGSLRAYTCTLRYIPWPGEISVAGVSLGAPWELVHERTVIVDPWKPGVVM